MSPEIPVPDDNTRNVAVYAIGGNALSDVGAPGDEALVLHKVMGDVVNLLEAGYRVVITHGNGPQVGDLLLLEETSMSEPKRRELDEWVAATQGMIGHSLALNLERHLMSKHRPERAAVVLTRVEVNENDIAFAAPTKPVGPILEEDTISKMDWDVATTVHGPRRVVASPQPIKIMDIDVINSLLGLNAVVICCGGGGIPVQVNDEIKGVPAVIDKDRVSALLATQVNADVFVVSTAVDAVRRDFAGPNEEVIRELSVEEAKKMVESGELPPGSMGPKVEAMVMAKESKSEMNVVLCQPGDALAAVRGDVGTRLV